MSRVKRVADRTELDRSVDEFVTRGYRITDRGRASARLKKNDRGAAGVHLLIAVLTVWWTLGLANTLYAIYRWVTAEEIVIRIEDETEESGEITGTETSPSAKRPTVQRTAPLRIVLRLVSLLVGGFVLLTIFAVHTGQIGLGSILPTVGTLAAVVAFRYVAVYHQFTDPLYRKLLLVPITVAGGVSSVVTARRVADSISVAGLRQVFQTESIGYHSSDFLPEWWIAAILVPAGLLLLLGALVPRDLDPYPRPTEIRNIAISPVYFGCLCAFFGLWAVLFVGISVQRVIVIAPIFEELLKFGIALLVGSALFDRSVLARVGVAAVVGSLFGLVEHATTYPAEPDSLYLFRTLFHMMTTVLSVSVYTVFESSAETRLRWLAPAFAIVIHFFYNTFAVLSSVVTVIVFGSQMTTLTLVYGCAAILVVTGLVVLVLLRHEAVRRLHMPLANVLGVKRDDGRR